MTATNTTETHTCACGKPGTHWTLVVLVSLMPVPSWWCDECWRKEMDKTKTGVRP